MTEHIVKFPRTPHLEGSRRQIGDDEVDLVPFDAIRGQQVVVEEKLDGANVGISFGSHGEMRLQSRGHYLGGGARERQFALLKTWAPIHHAELQTALGTRYILYGEWLYALHRIFYDALPHYLFALDVLDTASGAFLSAERRCALLAELCIPSPPVLFEGPTRSPEQLAALIGRSVFKTECWRSRIGETGLADPSDLMEGLYLRVERDGVVVDRYKYVRPTFRAALDDWDKRPIRANQLAAGVSLF